MRKAGIEGISRRGKRRRTTIPNPRTPPAPDLVNRRFQADGPNLLWVADLTCIPTYEGWLFLSAVVDMFSRKVVGWSMRNDLKADLVVDALSMAVVRRRPAPGVIHHSDRGSQYTSLAVFETIETFYNARRRHSSLDYKSPAGFETISASRKEEPAVAKPRSVY